MTSGIYRIDVGSHFYFGRATDLRGRELKHLSNLRLGDHVNTHLQNAYNKYQDFKFTVLTYCSPEFSVTLEQRLLDRYWGLQKCANIHNDSAGGAAGKDHPGSRGIIGVSEDGLTTVAYDTVREASSAVGMTSGSLVARVIQGARRPLSGPLKGFALGYSDDPDFNPQDIPTVAEHRAAVSQMCSERPVHPNSVKHGDAHSQALRLQLIHPDGSIFKKFGSVKSAAEFIGKSSSALWHYYTHEKPLARGPFKDYLLLKDRTP